MNTFVKRHRAERWMAVFLLGLFAYLSVWGYRAGGVGFFVFIALFGSLLTAFFAWLGTVVITVSEAGVTRKALFYHRHIPWEQVQRVAAVHMNLGGHSQWYLSVTCPSESGKTQGFLFDYSEDLRSALIRYYGSLDAERTDTSKARK